jgi:hypothetical protein
MPPQAIRVLLISGTPGAQCQTIRSLFVQLVFLAFHPTLVLLSRTSAAKAHGPLPRFSRGVSDSRWWKRPDTTLPG